MTSLIEIKTLKDLYNFIKDGHTFEEIYELTNYKEEYDTGGSVCECVDNFVYEDSDWEEFLDSLGIDLIETVNSTYVFSDENYIMLLDYEEHPNRFDSGLGNDFIVDFSTIRVSPSYSQQKGRS